MGRVVIDLTDSVELRIKAKNLAEAIEKLRNFKNDEVDGRVANLTRFKGIAKFEEALNEEEWYRQ